MAANPPVLGSEDQIEIDLRQPGLAAFWAWLWPGAGHLYQRRYAKGLLFMVCILTTYFFGFAMGGGRVVYASWTETDKRWQYLCQLGVGLPALPAVVQNRRMAKNRPLWLDGLMAPPRPGQYAGAPDDELAQWHKKYHLFFDLGTLYTMIAGLLNILAIYDAFAGPVLVTTAGQTDKPPPDRRQAASRKRRK
ncbi:MAG: hypothetical protein FJ276_13325 [Planctomycetes bacterium]|nr:hypothetical protein [Planctomycetota bacterium]